MFGTEEWKEGLNLEFKSGKGGLPKEFWPTYSAFANTKGGIILLGVADDGTIEGLVKPDERKNDLAVQLNNPQKCSSNLSSLPGMIEEVKIDGKTILAIRIPAAELKDRPIYIRGHLECSYFRQHESDIQCPESVLQQMIRDKAETSQDASIIPFSRMEDIDRLTFQQFRNRMGSFHPGHAWLDEDDKKLLTKLGGYRRDRNTGEEGITLAGLLMFGTNDSIGELFPQFQVNYYELDGTEDIHKRWSDRLTTDGTWTANLYQFFFKVLPHLNEGLKVPFKLNPDMTRQGESPAHVAVREALANALVHADYHGDGGIMIRKSPQGLEFSNPGTLLVAKEYIFTGGVSKCRNISLQKMFQFIGIVDKAGSGVDKIVKGWMEQCLCLPQVEEERNPARVVWRLPYLGLLPRKKQEKLIHKIGEDKYSALSVHERIILMMIPEDRYMGHKEIRELFPLHPSDLTKCLSRLAAAGYLSAMGRSNATKYTLYRGLTDQEHLGDSVPKPGDSVPKPEGSGLEQNFGLPLDLQDRLIQYRNNKRNKPEETDDMVVDICTGRWVTLAQLAELLDRKPDPLRRNTIQSLLRHNKLRRRYDEINHNSQAYTTVVEGVSNKETSRK